MNDTNDNDLSVTLVPTFFLHARLPNLNVAADRENNWFLKQTKNNL